jgi:multidrug transporter EmrE-like cation transporter
MHISKKEPLRAVHYAALFASICFGVTGQLLMKWAALGTTVNASTLSVLPQLALALAIYALGVVNWMLALRVVKLSVAYSVSSLNYVGVLFGAHYWFGEQIGMLRVAGVSLIFLGVVLVVARMPMRGTRSGTRRTRVGTGCSPGSTGPR